MSLAMPAAVSKGANIFELAKMKQLFGDPILLGGEKMKDFDEYANAIMECYHATDAILAALVYNYILESFKRMRLVRHQSRAVQAHVIQERSKSGRKDRESEMTSAMTAKLDLFSKFEYLISEAAKREVTLLQQISLYSILLAEKLLRKTAEEQKRLEIKQQKYELRRQKALDVFLAERDKTRAATENTVIDEPAHGNR